MFTDVNISQLCVYFFMEVFKEKSVKQLCVLWVDATRGQKSADKEATNKRREYI